LYVFATFKGNAMNRFQICKTEIALIDLLEKMDESRDHYDHHLATGDHLTASRCFQRMRDLAKEIDELRPTDAGTRTEFQP